MVKVSGPPANCS